jgi:hypothetical protein
LQRAYQPGLPRSRQGAQNGDFPEGRYGLSLGFERAVMGDFLAANRYDSSSNAVTAIDQMITF